VFGTLSPEAPPLLDYIGTTSAGGSPVMRGKPKILGTTSQICTTTGSSMSRRQGHYHASLLHTFSRPSGSAG